MDEGAGAGKDRAPGRAALRLCNLVAQSAPDAEGGLQAGGGEGADWEGNGALGADLLQDLQEPDPGDRAGDRNCRPDARLRQIARLLPRDDMRGLPSWCEPGQWRSPTPVAVGLEVLQVSAPRPETGIPG